MKGQMDYSFGQAQKWTSFQGDAFQSMGLPRGAWALGSSAMALPHTTQMVAPGSYSHSALPGNPTLTALNGSSVQQAFGQGNSTGIGF